jgi:hypothetical protein
MLYVTRRTTSYNTDVVHDVVRLARTTLYPYDIVRGSDARTTSYINVVRLAHTTLQYTMSYVHTISYLYRMSHSIRHHMIGLHIVSSEYCIQHRTRHRIRHCMRCSFNWIWSWVQGVQFACTITQAQEFAWQFRHRLPPHHQQAVPRHRSRSRQRLQGQQIPPPFPHHPHQTCRSLWC